VIYDSDRTGRLHHLLLHLTRVKTNEAVYLAGLHLEKYRHGTRDPEDYYREALCRDTQDLRNNNCLGLLLLRSGQFAKAEPLFRAAIRTQTKHNPNPQDGHPHYNLGVCLRFFTRLPETKGRTLEQIEEQLVGASVQNPKIPSRNQLGTLVALTVSFLFCMRNKFRCPAIKVCTALLVTICLPLLPTWADDGSNEPISLAGEWLFQLDRNNVGIEQKWFERKLSEHIRLPGSLPEQGFGDDVSAETRWTGDIVDKSWFTAP